MALNHIFPFSRAEHGRRWREAPDEGSERSEGSCHQHRALCAQPSPALTRPSPTAWARGKYLKALNTLFPSPLWGGVRGGGLVVFQTSECRCINSAIDAPRRGPDANSFDTPRPPPLTPPHKGEGNVGGEPALFLQHHSKPSPYSRHPGESRDPLNSLNASSAAQMSLIQWVPAFAGMTD
jgi:hypothetical protein